MRLAPEPHKKCKCNLHLCAELKGVPILGALYASLLPYMASALTDGAAAIRVRRVGGSPWTWLQQVRR